MRIRILQLFILGALALTACSGAGEAVTTPPGQEIPDEVSEEATGGEGSSTAAMCTTRSLFTEEDKNSPLPTASDADWSRGPADAAVTIIEYGDFQ